MRAIRQSDFGDASVLHIEQVPVPEPLPTEVRVRVFAAGVNPVDWKTRAGGGMAGVLGELPFGMGWDVSGVVDAVGFGVTTLKAGDEVYGMPWFPREASAYSEYVTAPSRHFAPKPTSISHIEAAGAPLAALTAWQAIVDTAKVEPGQRVLVHAAAGGVGHIAVQIAVALGATVIGTGSAAREAFVRSLGAQEFIDYRADRFEEHVKNVDVVIDLIGDADQTALRSVDTLAPGGTLVGIPGGVGPDVAAAAEARGVHATGFLVEPDHTALAHIAKLIDAQKIRVVIQEVFPLERAGEAHLSGESGRTQGKLVIEVRR